MHCTASSKLFLADLPRVQRDALIWQLPFTRMTRHTLTSANTLKAECDTLAEQGHLCEREEFIAGLIAAARMSELP